MRVDPCDVDSLSRRGCSPGTHTFLPDLPACVQADTEALDAFDSSSICSGESMHSSSTHSSSVPSERRLAGPDGAAAARGACSGTTSLGAGSVPVGVGVAAVGSGELGLRPGLPGAPAVIPEEIRKARRRESNRNASSKYRSRKTATVSTLMEDNSALRQQLAALGSQVG